MPPSSCLFHGDAAAVGVVDADVADAPAQFQELTVLRPVDKGVIAGSLLPADGDALSAAEIHALPAAGEVRRHAPGGVAGDEADAGLQCQDVGDAHLLAGVAVALISMKTETERLQESEERYQQQKQKTIEAEEEHRRKIEELCSIAGDEAVSTDARREALNKLEQKYPDIFSKYDTEYEKLKNIKKIIIFL